LKQGKVEDAESSFRQSVKINPGYAQAHEALGELLLYRGKLDEAIATLRIALEITPSYSKAREVLVKALQANGQNREAKKNYEREPAAVRGLRCGLCEDLLPGKTLGARCLFIPSPRFTPAWACAVPRRLPSKTNRRVRTS